MQYLYAGVLAFVVVATLPLEIVLRARVYSRARRWLLTLLPVLVVFLAWDLWAVEAGHWDYSTTKTLGLQLMGLPIEEVLFFVVVPTAAILTLEAVRSVRGWTVGDEAPERSGPDF